MSRAAFPHPGGKERKTNMQTEAAGKPKQLELAAHLRVKHTLSWEFIISI
jgi:hypothetical protein